MDAAGLVAHRRRTSGLTQEQLAVRAGTTKTAISRLERGHVSPTIETLQRLLLCMGHELNLDSRPIATRTDPVQIDAVANLTPEQRLHHGLASQLGLTELLGAARER